MQYTIIMVDDEVELLKMLHNYFKLKQYSVITAENGMEAVEKVKLNPDTILLDINMPLIDGI